MKKLLLSFCLMAIMLSANAQNEKSEAYKLYRSKGFNIEATASTGMFDVPMLVAHQMPYLLAIGPTSNYRFNRYVCAGLGAEFQMARGGHTDYPEFDKFMIGVPVFANIKVNMGRGHISPFFAARAGMIFGFNDVYKNNYGYRFHGLYTDLGFGLSIKYSNVSIGMTCSDMLKTYQCTGVQYYGDEVETVPNLNFYIRYSYSFGL